MNTVREVRVWTNEAELARILPNSRFIFLVQDGRDVAKSFQIETEATLRKICQFWDEAFEPQMLSWERMADEQVPAQEPDGIPKKLNSESARRAPPVGGGIQRARAVKLRHAGSAS
jgi:hypothetical protein